MFDLVPLGHPSTWERVGPAPVSGYVEMIKFLRNLQNQNDDAMILLDGAEGAGKSTVAFWLARHLDKEWDPETGLIIDYDDWEEIYSLETGKVFILDEGGDLMFSREAGSYQNKMLVRMFQMSRIFNHILIVCCPNIHWVDLYIRSHRALFYGHVIKKYHKTGIERGWVDWKWPKRWWDQKHSEWVTDWLTFNTSRFEAVENDIVWQRYEELKRLKVQTRRLEFTERLSKGKGR